MHVATRKTAGRLLRAVGMAAVLALSSGCNPPFFGDRVTVANEPPALAAAFDRLCSGPGTARVGDLVAESGIAIGEWDRWYSFSAPFSEEKINSTLGTRGADWYSYSNDEHVRTEVFVRDGRVVYAFTNYLRAGHGFNPTVNHGKYATPDSMVTSQVKKGEMIGEADVCRTEIQGAG
ncbi:hypothetical protein [Nocardia amamiensis]|uniref:hypothetical protein n=1 Tax=Nocardia amamiensis TaxID=404578 RepID=UPI000A608CBD|nr:hypothetical protein [Nocardia amamiensis]